MDANSSASCSSTSLLTNRYLITILGSLSAISLVTCLAALILLLYYRLHGQFLYRLAAYQVFGSLLYVIFEVFQFSFLSYSDSQYIWCVTVAFLKEVAAIMKLSFGAWITFHLFFFAVLFKNMKKLEPLYVISSVVLAVLVASVPLITHSYGPTGEWCWIQGKRCGVNYLAGFIEQIAVFYGPILVLLVLQSAAMLIMMFTVYCRAHRNMDNENVYGCEQNKKAFRQLLPLVAYPITFCIFVIPPLINRVYEFAGASNQNRDLLILSAVCLPSWSFSAGVTLIIHILVIKLRCGKRVAYAQNRSIRRNKCSSAHQGETKEPLLI